MSTSRAERRMPDCGALKAMMARQVTVTENVLPKQGNRPLR